MTRRRRRQGEFAWWWPFLAALVMLGFCAGVVMAHSPHVVQPGETLQSIARSHLGSSARWREIASANGIANPRRLPPGMILKISSAEPRDVATHVAGTAEYRANEAEPWRRLSPDAAIPESGEVRTDADGLVTVKTSEGATLRIRGSSAVRLRPPAASARTVMLLRGAVAAKLIRGGPTTLNIATPASVAGVRGTDFLVEHDADAQRSSVSVWEGQVHHTAQEVTVEVGAGYGSSVHSGSLPTRPVLLPYAPALVAPVSGARVDEGVADFRWRPAPGAASYLLEIAGDPAFTRLIVIRIVEAAAGDSFVAAHIGHLPVGAIYWRVAARTADALEGSPSSARTLTIGDPLSALRRLYNERRFNDVINRVNAMDSPGFRPSILQAWAYYRLNFIDNAERAFRKMNETSPDNDEIELGLAYCAFRLGRDVEAEQGFREVLRLDPASAQALLGIGHIKYRQERWAEAIDFYEQCLRLSPENSEAIDYLQDARAKNSR